MKQVRKIGKTYIQEENITLAQFRVKFEMPGYKVEVLTDPNQNGYALTNGGDMLWWVGDKFFNENYEEIK